MAEQNKDSVLDMQDDKNQEQTKPEKSEKTTIKLTCTKSQIIKTHSLNVQFGTLTLILAVACIFLRLFTLFLAFAGATGSVFNVFSCINIIAVIATLALYLIDVLKNKNNVFNATFVMIVLAVLIMFI